MREDRFGPDTERSAPFVVRLVHTHDMLFGSGRRDSTVLVAAPASGWPTRHRRPIVEGGVQGVVRRERAEAGRQSRKG